MAKKGKKQQKKQPLQVGKKPQNEAAIALPKVDIPTTAVAEPLARPKAVAKPTAQVAEKPRIEKPEVQKPVLEKPSRPVTKPVLEKPTAPASNNEGLRKGIIASHRHVDNKLLFTRILSVNPQGKTEEIVWFKPAIQHALNTEVSFETYVYQGKLSATNVAVIGARNDLNAVLPKQRLRTMFYTDFVRLVLEGKDPKELAKGLVGSLDDGNTLVYVDTK